MAAELCGLPSADDTTDVWNAITDAEESGDAKALGKIAEGLFVTLGEERARSHRLRAEVHRLTGR